MRLTSLHIAQLTGIEGALGVSDLTAGVNVIVGPNASGKSSLLRALLALLYPSEFKGVIGAEARFLTATGSELVARRLGQDVAWELAGRSAPAPALPAYHLVGAYTLRLEDLVTAAEVPAAKPGQGRPPAVPGTAGLATGTHLDRFIADRLVMQLTGGIDMEQVRRSLGGQSEAGRKLAATVKAEAKELKRLRQDRAALADREARLPRLREEREAAREQARLSASVADAIVLLKALEEAAEIAVELGSFPPDLDKLRGDEDEVLARLREASASEAAKLEACEAELAAVLRALDGNAVADDLDAGAVSMQLERAAGLVEDEARLAVKVGERQALLAQLREVDERVGGAPDAPSDGVSEVGAVTMQLVEELLQQRQSARADEDALEKQLSRLQAAMPPQPPEAGGTDEQLLRLRANLLRWLAAPSVERRRPAWSWGVALALTTAVVLAGSLGVSSDVLLVLAGATGAWLLITWLAVRPLASNVRAQIEAETLRAQAQYGVVVPVSWEHAEVADLVASLADELAERGRLTAARLQSAEAQRGIAADLESARGKVLKAEQELDALRARFGFAVGPTVALSAWLHAVRDRHRLKTALAGVQVEGGTLDKRVKHTRAELLAFLAGAGRETLATSPTAEGVGEQRGDQLRAALRSVARAVEQRDADRLKLTSLTRDSDRSRSELQRLTGEVERLVEAAGLVAGQAVEDEVRRRVAALPAWREAHQRQRVSEARVAALEQRLANHEDLRTLAAGGDLVGLHELAAECSAAQARSEMLASQIAKTEHEIELAASDTSIELTAARLADAVEELSAHREKAVQLATALFLLDAIEAEHRSEAQPPALARAAALFERFTHREFFLRFESETGTRRRLAAADSTGRLLGLDQLSTGTRAQLLIASRLAFALEAEDAAGAAPGGGAGDALDSATNRLGLPFFLDEALTTSDPQRFAAVASAILDVAALEGRQFIYLSARSDDAELWQRAAAKHGSSISVVQLGSQGTGKAASPAAS